MGRLSIGTISNMPKFIKDAVHFSKHPNPDFYKIDKLIIKMIGKGK